MRVEEVKQIVGEVPFMTLRQARAMTEFITEHRLRDILELGFYHGVSTCYIAGTLKENGGGSVVTIDLENVRSLTPNVDELLGKCGLSDMVTVWYEPTSYVWRMMKMLEEDPEPRFDMCYIDGAHNWFVDALAFFLADRLVRPGGWVVFDDLDWTYDTSPTNRDAAREAGMPEDERTTPQIRKIYELLVRPHSSYGEFMVKDGWAYARKVAEAGDGKAAVRREVVYVSKPHGKTLRGLVRKLMSR